MVASVPTGCTKKSAGQRRLAARCRAAVRGVKRGVDSGPLLLLVVIEAGGAVGFSLGWNQYVFQDTTGEWWLPSPQGLVRMPNVDRFEDLATATQIRPT